MKGTLLPFTRYFFFVFLFVCNWREVCSQLCRRNGAWPDAKLLFPDPPSVGHRQKERKPWVAAQQHRTGRVGGSARKVTAVPTSGVDVGTTAGELELRWDVRYLRAQRQASSSSAFWGLSDDRGEDSWSLTRSLS